MTRILMLKNRRSEYLAMSKVQDRELFPEDFIPLVEIIKEKKKCDKKIDPDTGEHVTVRKKTRNGTYRNFKVDDPSTERDITLQEISELFNGRQVFVEYFRCNLNLYKKNDPEQNRLVVELNLNLDKYCDRTLQISQYQNLVPVIAIKDGIDKLSPESVSKLINDIRAISPQKPIAIRIDNLEGYEESLAQSLTSRDYLLYDISEQPIDSRTIEYDELKKQGFSARLILLCSPRGRNLAIKDFEVRGYTCLIDNSVVDKFNVYGFDGFGDYGGLGDELPTQSFGNREKPGRALALLYNGRKRAFKSYVCDDITLGPKGYAQLMDSIFSDRNELDPDHSCAVYQQIEQKIALGAKFTYGEWKQYTLIRYIQQISAE